MIVTNPKVISRFKLKKKRHKINVVCESDLNTYEWISLQNNLGLKEWVPT